MRETFERDGWRVFITGRFPHVRVSMFRVRAGYVSRTRMTKRRALRDATAAGARVQAQWERDHPTINREGETGA